MMAGVRGDVVCLLRQILRYFSSRRDMSMLTRFTLRIESHQGHSQPRERPQGGSVLRYGRCRPIPCDVS